MRAKVGSHLARPCRQARPRGRTRGCALEYSQGYSASGYSGVLKRGRDLEAEREADGVHRLRRLAHLRPIYSSAAPTSVRHARHLRGRARARERRMRMAACARKCAREQGRF